MDLWTVIARRCSIRRFTSEEVSASTVQKILEAAIRAPSAGNRQPWHFVVVRRAAVKEALAQAAYGQDFVAEAPVVIVVCAEPERSALRYGARGRDLYCLQDTAAATEHILLAATALGLGCCWVGAFDEKAAARALALPSQFRPIAMVPIGQAAEPMARTPRRPLSEVTSYLE
nr:nitroreductase family protein [Chloroflexota bacterium]